MLITVMVFMISCHLQESSQMDILEMARIGQAKIPLIPYVPGYGK